MREEAETRSALEFQRCNALAERSTKILTISHFSALRCWGVGIDDPGHGKYCMHICVSRHSGRTHLKGVKAHVWHAECEPFQLPGANFLLASPAASWAQIASYVSDEELIITGSSLLRRDMRLKTATKEKLEDYVNLNQGFKGRARCLRTLPLLVENTDSTPEVRVYLLLQCNGIRGLHVNHCVRYPNGRRSYIDIAIPELRIAIEYQGEYHSDPAQMRADAARCNELIRLGWIVVMVTSSDLNSEASQRRLVELILTLIEQRTHLAGLWPRK